MDKYCTTVELPKIIERLAQLCTCDGARALARQIEPVHTIEEAKNLMERTVDANTLTIRYSTPSVSGIQDCAGILQRAKIGAKLSPGELLTVAGILRAMETMTRWRDQLEDSAGSLEFLLDGIASIPSLRRDIVDAILSEDEIADNASADLANIRRKIRQAGAKARDVLEHMVRSQTYQKFLQESIITQRDGRFVVPVKMEYRSEIRGLVHDTSSSGATVFIEPMAVVEANNEIRLLQNEEKAEVDRILYALSGQVGDCADSIQGSYEILIELDLYFAKSRLADEQQATVPVFNENGMIDLHKARHPLIPKESVVPIDLRLGKDFDTLVVTGPNTGGKTVAIKTLGLLQMMAQCGLMLPVADGSTLPVFEKLLVDIGDEQSIEQSLSTFSAHMTNIVKILGQANEKTLVLLDELGAGTDPVEGAALAVAIIEQLRHQGAKIVATTHYAEIKMFALNTLGVENASCEFDVTTLRPTYRLLIGVPGRSNAFAIGERLGLPGDIIENARQHVSRDNARFEDVVSQLETARQELEYEKETAAAQRLEAQQASEKAEDARKAMENERERELERARIQARSIVEQVTAQAQKLLDELDALRKEKENADFAQMAAQAKVGFKADMRKLQELADPVMKKSGGISHIRPLRRGDMVHLVEMNRDGTVLSAPDGQGYITVQAGILKTKVHQSEVRLLNQQDKQATSSHSGYARRDGIGSKAARQIKTELDLRGMTADEAIMEVDRFIDSCVMSGLETVRIIHGKGTGVLRSAVQKHLKSHRNVKSFRLGVYGEGEAGVTVAVLK